MLALLLVSGVSVGSQLSFANVLPIEGGLHSFNLPVGQLASRVDQLASVTSTWDIISYWLQPLTNWLGNLWERAVTAWQDFFNGRPKEITINDVPSAVREQILQTATSGVRYGVLVTPSTGSTSRDEALKKSLSQMFADRVNLRFDQGGTSGVVTPVFRDGRTGGDYIFVLTPLR